MKLSQVIHLVCVYLKHAVTEYGRRLLIWHHECNPLSQVETCHYIQRVKRAENNVVLL